MNGKELHKFYKLFFMKNKKNKMEKQQTCGKGLAEHSVLPAKLAELITSIAKNLELHMETLDLTDPDSRREYNAYQKLVYEHREIADQLKETAVEMEGYGS